VWEREKWKDLIQMRIKMTKDLRMEMMKSTNNLNRIIGVNIVELWMKNIMRILFRRKLRVLLTIRHQIISKFKTIVRNKRKQIWMDRNHLEAAKKQKIMNNFNKNWGNSQISKGVSLAFKILMMHSIIIKKITLQVNLRKQI